MTLEEAKSILNACVREELRDCFGDREVSWMKDGREVASGYFGSTAGVNFIGTKANADGYLPMIASFTANEAYELVRCGKMVNYERNDVAGPDRYSGA